MKRRSFLSALLMLPFAGLATTRAWSRSGTKILGRATEEEFAKLRAKSIPLMPAEIRYVRIRREESQIFEIDPVRVGPIVVVRFL